MIKIHHVGTNNIKRNKKLRMYRKIFKKNKKIRIKMKK